MGDPTPVELVNRYGLTGGQLIEMAQRHLEELLALDFDPGPLAARHRRERCTHEWTLVTARDSYRDADDIAPECTHCGIRVLDGYRPYYPRKEVLTDD